MPNLGNNAEVLVIGESRLRLNPTISLKRNVLRAIGR